MTTKVSTANALNCVECGVLTEGDDFADYDPCLSCGSDCTEAVYVTDVALAGEPEFDDEYWHPVRKRFEYTYFDLVGRGLAEG